MLMLLMKRLEKTVKKAIVEVAPASFYSLMVIAVSFLPIFALENQEGRMFKPLAYTKTLSMIVAAFMSVTLVPALLLVVTRIRPFNFSNIRLNNILNRFWIGSRKPEDEHPISKALFKVYGPIVDYVVDKRYKVVLASIALMIATIPVYFKLGSEFMPPLNEGTILYMPTTMPGISVSEARNLLVKQDQILKSFPEVLSVHGKAGHADTSTDPAPLSMMETVVVLKQRDEWRKEKRWYSFLPEPLKFPFSFFYPENISYEKLISLMNEKMNFPGLTNAWTQPIKGRIDMLTTGIRTPIGIKISGSDLSKMEEIGLKIEKILGGLEGTRSVFAERVTGGYFLDFNFNREALARHGISISDAQTILATAIGGSNVTTAVDGRNRYTVNLRYARAFRQNLEDFKNILIESPKGYQIPLSEVANLEILNGPGAIRNENGLLTSYVYVDIDESDLGSYVEKAKKIVSKELKVPTGYSLIWSGQYESLERVKENLSYIVPLTLALIFF